MTSINVEHLSASVGRALPGAEPFAAIPLFAAQVRWLDAEAGRDLVEQVVTRAHPSTWGFDDALLDSWPPLVAERAVAAIRALPRGEARIEGLCRIAGRLTRAEQREALEGVLDGTFREVVIGHAAVSRRATIVAFVRTLPDDDREAWVRAKAVGPIAFLSEVLARSDVGILTEHALRDLWGQIPAPAPGEVPREYQRLAHRLPVDLRQQALAAIRACTRQSNRLLHLAAFDEELTESERREVVEVPWNEHTRDDPRSQIFHLWLVEHHLAKVAPGVRHRWLSIVLAYEDPYVRQVGLFRLLPSLCGEDRASAEAALLASVEQAGCFYGDARWDLVPDDALDALLLRLRDDPYGWNRDELIEHVLDARPSSTADRLGSLLLKGIDDRAADTRLEIVYALTPWLAERTGGAMPRALATLPVPCSEAAPDAQYAIARVHRLDGAT
jgi:hypothetical protein